MTVSIRSGWVSGSRPWSGRPSALCDPDRGGRVQPECGQRLLAKGGEQACDGAGDPVAGDRPEDVGEAVQGDIVHGAGGAWAGEPAELGDEAVMDDRPTWPDGVGSTWGRCTASLPRWRAKGCSIRSGPSRSVADRREPSIGSLHP